MRTEDFRHELEALGVTPGGRVLAACSGGTDSVALLWLLRETPGVEVVCGHFHHGLRGVEADRDEAFVRTLCERWDLPFRVGHAAPEDYPAGGGTEAAARALRYRFLERAARENGCLFIATAHNAEDNAETVLLNLLRGSGARGLGGIPPVREFSPGLRLIRPLLRVSRSELTELLEREGLSHVEDATNAGDAYTRNRLRHSVFPLLRDLNPAAVAHIGAAAALLREDEDYLDGLAATFLAERMPAGGALPLDPFAALPKPVAMRVLRRLAGSPGRGHLDRLYALCLDGREGAALDLPEGRAEKRGGFLRFGAVSAPGVSLPRREVIPGGTLDLPEIGKRLRCFRAVYKVGEEIYSSFNTFCFQSEKICGKITVASRAPGDRIRLSGRGCTKPLRRLLSEAGIPAAERDSVPVFSDGLGVIAVAGFGMAERCAPAEGQEAIVIRIGDRTGTERGS